MIRRREFIAGIGGAAVWPLAMRAQPVLPLVGYLGVGDGSAPLPNPMKQGLAETGFVEGRNFAFERRWAGFHRS